MYKIMNKYHFHVFIGFDSWWIVYLIKAKQIGYQKYMYNNFIHTIVVTETSTSKV